MLTVDWNKPSRIKTKRPFLISSKGRECECWVPSKTTDNNLNLFPRFRWDWRWGIWQGFKMLFAIIPAQLRPPCLNISQLNWIHFSNYEENLCHLTSFRNIDWNFHRRGKCTWPVDVDFRSEKKNFKFRINPPATGFSLGSCKIKHWFNSS